MLETKISFRKKTRKTFDKKTCQVAIYVITCSSFSNRSIQHPIEKQCLPKISVKSSDPTIQLSAKLRKNLLKSDLFILIIFDRISGSNSARTLDSLRVRTDTCFLFIMLNFCFVWRHSSWVSSPKKTASNFQ